MDRPLTSQDRLALWSGTHVTTETAIRLLKAAIPRIEEITVGVIEGHIEPEPIPHEVGGFSWMHIQYSDGSGLKIPLGMNDYGDDVTPNILSIYGLEGVLLQIR